MMLKRVTNILLALVIIFPLVACSKTADTDKSNSKNESNNSSESTVSEVSEATMFSDLPEINYNGREVKILEGGLQWGERYQSREIFADETKDELINNAVLERNNIVEEKFGIKITGHSTGVGENLFNMVTTLYNSGDSEYDIIAPKMNEAAVLAARGYFYNLKTIPNMRLDRDFWDQRAVEDLEIMGKVYFATGYIGILDNDSTQCMIFNKTVAKEYLDEDLYQLVKDGKWTIDKMLELARKVSADTDGDQQMTYNDLWGLYINIAEPTHMFVAAGQRYIQKDEDGNLYITVNTEQSNVVINKLAEVMADRKASIIIENLREEATAAGFADVYYLASEQIASGKALLRTMSLIDLEELADKQFEFGILPLPKFDENQDNYYSNVSTWSVPGYTIPVQAEDKDLSALVLSALCEASEDTLNEAYYDKLLTKRRFVDTESREMLDIIFHNRVYDLGVVFNWGGIRDIVTDAVKNGENNFASTWDSKQDVIKNEMQKTIEAFQSVSD